MVDLVSVRGRCKRREAHYPPRPVTLSRRATVYRHERGALRHRLPSGVPRPLWRAVRGGGGARLRVDRGGRLPVGVPRTLRSPHRGRPPHAAEPPRPPRHQSAHAAPRGDGQRDLERGRAFRWPRSARARLGRQRDLHHRGAAHHPRRSGGFHPDAPPAHRRRERGARMAGRSVDDVDVWWFAKTSLADHRDEAIEPIKMALAASANHAFRFTLEGKGVPLDLYERIRALQREYNAHHHELPGAANASLPDRWGLTEFLVDRFAIAGTPGECIAQIQRAMAAGARQFIITGFVPDPSAFMRRWAREVAARL